VNKPSVRVSGLKKLFPRNKKSSLLHLVYLGKSRPLDSSLGYKALSDISFSLKVGQSLGIIGKNGAGKSTLLQILSGIIQPSSGTYEIKGRVASLLELGSGFNPEFTGRENIFLYASIYGIPQSTIKSRINKIIEFAEIEEFIDNPIRTYSTGMQMRLAFSIVSEIDAQILLIDEAFAVGDSFFVQKCFRFIKEFKKRGILILVSHDHHSIKQFCNSCIWLEKGKMIMNGEPKTVIDSYLSKILLSNESDNAKTININPTKTDFLEFGSLKAKIICCKLIVNETESSFVEGGDSICLKIIFKMEESLNNITVGFIIRNKFGVDIFSEKTSRFPPFVLFSQSHFTASFNFKMPILKAGDYFICVALAEVSEKKNNILHWINDCIKLEISNTENVEGIFRKRDIKSSIQQV